MRTKVREHLAKWPGLTAHCTCGAKDHTEHPTRVPTGGAVPVPGFDLPARWVILTAGPIWPSDPEAQVLIPNDPPSALAGMQMKLGVKSFRAEDIARETLRACHKMAVLTAVGMGLKSIAFPAISTGVYGCPMEQCAEVALPFCRDYYDWPIDVSFYLFPATALPVWQEAAETLGVKVED